jgi:hypothetical protein
VPYTLGDHVAFLSVAGFGNVRGVRDRPYPVTGGLDINDHVVATK